MDLSKLSNEDLMALSKGDYKSISNEGLSYINSSNAPAEKIQEDNELAINPATGRPEPLMSADTLGRLLDLQRGAVVTGAAGAISPIVGEQVVTKEDVLNALTGNAPELQEYLGRMGMEEGPLRKGVGFAGDVLADFIGPGAIKVLPKTGALVAKGGKEGFSLLKNIAEKAAEFSKGEAKQYLENPKKVAQFEKMLSEKENLDLAQDAASGVIDKMNKTLLDAGLAADKEMTSLLSDKFVNIDADKVRKLLSDAPGAEEVLKGIPESGVATIPATQARKIKQLAQEEAKYSKSIPSIGKGTPRHTEYSGLAGEVGSSLKKLDPKVAELDNFMSKGIASQEALQQGLNKPLQFLKTGSEDVAAEIARAAKKTGSSEIFELSDQLGAARKIIGKPSESITTAAKKFGGRMGLKAYDFGAPIGRPIGNLLGSDLTESALRQGVWIDMLKKEQEKQK